MADINYEFQLDDIVWHINELDKGYPTLRSYLYEARVVEIRKTQKCVYYKTKRMHKSANYREMEIPASLTFESEWKAIRYMVGKLTNLIIKFTTTDIIRHD